MKKALIFLILLFSVSALSAENYWTLISQIGSTPSSFAFSSNDVMYAGTLGSGVYRSTNYGNSWTQVNSGLTDLTVYSLAVNSAGQIFAGSGSHGIYYSSNNGFSWIHTSLSATAKVKAIAINSSSHIFAGTNGSGIYRSSNNGSIWTLVTPALNVYDIAIDASGRIFAAVGSPNEAVYRSTDNGNTWQQRITADHNFNCIAVNNSGTIFAATGDLNTDDLMGDIIARSFDGGETWDIPSIFGTSSYGMVINSISYVFLGRYRSVWVSTDRGVNWDIKSSGLDLDKGILISYGVNSQGYIFAGQEGGYIYRTLYSTIGIKKLTENIPVSFALYQNYPNPFNPATTVKFDIPAGTKNHLLNVKITVYDILGRQVTELLNEDLSPGAYEINWDASNQPSGIYFYNIITGEFTATRKMMLVK